MVVVLNVIVRPVNIILIRMTMIINTPEELGKMLKRLRQEADLSGQTLAEKSGIEQPHISKIERGKVNVTLSTLIKIAHAFGKRINISIE